MDFNDRMFLASEDVYARIQRDECDDVTAELMNATLQASTEED